MTLGGVDQRIHAKKTVSYVKMESKSNGEWLLLVLCDVWVERVTSATLWLYDEQLFSAQTCYYLLRLVCI